MTNRSDLFSSMPPEVSNVPRSVVITDAEAFQMPHKCVICGQEVSSLLSYTQDHVPIIVPGVAWVRTTEVSLPYCEDHADAFQQRFRTFRIFQGVVYVILLVAVFTIFFPPVRKLFGWGLDPGVVSNIVIIALFLCLVITIFCIKPFLYDAFISQSGNRLRIRSRSPIFIKNVIESNRSILQYHGQK